jgi:ribonucleoside-diphosphate reductase beta chain
MLTKGHAYDLYQLAKRCAWNPHPQDLDFRQDVQDWAMLNPREQDILCRLLSMFVGGEEAVASDLAPLLWAIGRAGGLREEGACGFQGALSSNAQRINE